MEAAFDLETTIDFIADLSLYETEKPFFVYPSLTQSKYSPDDELSNVQWETHPVTVHSIRDTPDLVFEQAGFRYLEHESAYLSANDLDTAAKYQKETEELLGSCFNAEFIKCYIYKVAH